MSWFKARRRRPVAGYAALLLGLVMVTLVYGAVAGTGGGGAQAQPASPSSDISAGETLFNASCATCHGFGGVGHPGIAPSLIGAGAAAVDFQMSTGRMPAKEDFAENERKPTLFTQQQIYEIADYIQSLGGGPTIPDAQQVSTSGANTALGEELFSANCAQCHNAGLSGGALTYGKDAPPLTQATATQIYEAMLTGPEAMPVFADGAVSPQAKRDIIAYVLETRSEPNPGGLTLGRMGPVTEGLVIFLGGMGFLVLIAMWITAKRREPWTVEGSLPGSDHASEPAGDAWTEH
ncbi:MAG: cytochrome bc1 complex diheme cytochrome c subunit [Streptosporangiaceae bacterium]